MPTNKKAKKKPTIIKFENFAGFEYPKMTDVPDQIFDEFLPKFTGAELKVILYICRKTFGWKKDSDDIALSQLLHGVKTGEGKIVDRGTGLSKPTLLEALRALEKNRLIIRERKNSPEKGNEATNFKLNLKGDNEEDEAEASKKNYTLPGKKSLPRDGKKTSPRSVVKKATTQYNNNNVYNNVNVEEDRAKSEFENPFTTNKYVSGLDLQKTNNKNKSAGEINHLADQILEVCGDSRSTAFYLQIAELCPSNLIHRNLATVKDMKGTNQIKKSPGALFTALIKKDAEENGIDLKLKS